MNDAETRPDNDLREIHYETPNGGHLRIPVHGHEIPAILRELDAAYAKVADRALRLEPRTLQARLVQWLMANADGTKRTTQEIIQGALGVSLNSSDEADQTEYKRVYWHLKNADEALTKRGFQLQSEASGTEDHQKLWWLEPRSPP